MLYGTLRLRKLGIPILSFPDDYAYGLDKKKIGSIISVYENNFEKKRHGEKSIT